MNTLHALVLASGADFFTTTLGAVVASVMKAVALIVVLLSAVRSIKHVTKGETGKAVGTILGTCLIVAFLWKPELISSLIDLAAGLVGKGVTTGSELTR